MRPTILPTLLSAALLAGCGGDGEADKAVTKPVRAAPPGAARQTDSIRIADFKYEPPSATVRAGEAIAVPNADDAPHTLTDTAKAAFDSGTIKGKASGSITVERPGTYKYFCEFHPFMKGEIRVVGS